MNFSKLDTILDLFVNIAENLKSSHYSHINHAKDMFVNKVKVKEKKEIIQNYLFFCIPEILLILPYPSIHSIPKFSLIPRCVQFSNIFMHTNPTRIITMTQKKDPYERNPECPLLDTQLHMRRVLKLSMKILEIQVCFFYE